MSFKWQDHDPALMTGDTRPVGVAPNDQVEYYMTGSNGPHVDRAGGLNWAEEGTAAITSFRRTGHTYAGGELVEDVTVPPPFRRAGPPTPRGAAILTEAAEGASILKEPDVAALAAQVVDLDKPSYAVRLPLDALLRKDIPIASGCLDYFPDALAEVARLSKVSNDKHNPGQPLHWSRGKSNDHADTLIRHFTERGTVDPSDGFLHDVKVAWRALALLQETIERERGLPPARGSIPPVVEVFGIDVGTTPAEALHRAGYPHDQPCRCASCERKRAPGAIQPYDHNRSRL